MASLLPADHAEFNTKDYWNRFFQQRNRSAFEWYGSFADVVPSLLPVMHKTDDVLVIGCGNSNFSSELYDLGYQKIVNLDFSELVIAEMREKNTHRVSMTWEVGDMTNMEAHQPESFDVVVDKGALDALLSADTPELRLQAVKMFDEIERVLSSHGKYICISLAENFVLSTLLAHFVHSNSNWRVDVWPITTSTRSPFMPLMFVIAKEPTRAQRLNLHVTTTGQKTSTGLELAPSKAEAHLSSLQQFLSMSYRIGALEPGRFEVVHFYAQNPTDPVIAAIPRFTIYIVDVSEQAQQSCVVFLVPLGRESEYQFTSKNGLVDLAFQANTKRLISVCCNRPHVFPDSAGLQAELSPIMMTLKPVGMPSSEQIPYLGVGQDEAWEVLEEGHSDVSGSYVIEERDHEASGGVVRRLIFLQNQQLVQTEARLLRSKKAVSSSKGKGGGKKSSAKRADSEDALAFDYQFVDDHHRAVLAAAVLVPTLPVQAAGERGKTGLVVGLGGGALVMCLQRLLPQLQLTVCEIDGAVQAAAEKYFAFTPRKHTSVVVRDGLALIDDCWAAQPRSTFDLVVFDVDSKDLTVGLSAPPKAFVHDEMLRRTRDLLTDQGMLIINVAARSAEAFQEIVESLTRVFGGPEHIFALQPSRETVNVEVVCLKARPAAAAATGGKKKDTAPKPSVQWNRTLDAWLKSCGQSDFLELEELVDKIAPIAAFRAVQL